MKDRHTLQKLKSTNSITNKTLVWFKQADYDLAASRLSLENGFNEWSAYQAQQAVEKALKAVLIHAGWRPPRLHKIPILMSIANRVNPAFSELQFKFKHLESFTFISRYPFLVPGVYDAPHDAISSDDARKALEQASDIMRQISVFLKRPGSEIIHEKPVLEDYYDNEQITARLEEVTEIFKTNLNPQKIILFGGYARNHQNSKSGTMDILIIAESELSFIERITHARKLTRGAFPIVEPLVYTPEEFQVMVDEEGEGFLETALEEGKVLYQKV